MENNNTMEELLSQYGEVTIPKKGDILAGTVVQINNDEVVVSVGYKSDGIVPKNEISSNPESVLKNINVDDEIEVYVLNSDDGEGNVLLSMKRVNVFKDFEDLIKIYENDEVVKVNTVKAVKGGIIAYYNEVRGFIPASHLSVRYVNNIEKFVNKELEVKVIEVNKRRNKVIFSRKQVVAKELKSMRNELWEKIEKTDIVEGEVKRITSFGAFIDIGGIDGLAHISELSWGRIKSPKEIVKVGDTVKVKILDFNKEEEKISLSIKQLTENPWETVKDRYATNGVFEGTVVNLTDFGVFVKLEDGVEGLVHISQISKDRIEKPSDILSVNDKVDVKVLEVDLENKKIKLSIKEVGEDSTEEDAE